MASATLFFIFNIFSYNKFIHKSIRWGSSLVSSLLFAQYRVSMGCRAGIRIRVCRTASRRTTIWAAPHPNELRRTLKSCAAPKRSYWHKNTCSVCMNRTVWCFCSSFPRCFRLVGILANYVQSWAQYRYFVAQFWNLLLIMVNCYSLPLLVGDGHVWESTGNIVTRKWLGFVL